MREGWEKQRLEDCFKLKSGDNMTTKMMGEDGKYPVFGGNGIAGLHNKFNLSGSNVIIGRVGALCGNVRHITEKIWLTDNAFKIVDFKYEFDHLFLTYLLNFKNLREHARQSAQPVISNSSLKDVILEFPKSLSEQQRIVAILDEAFATVAKAKANAEQNLKNAKELFESYLQGVFEQRGEGWEEKQLGEVCSLITKGSSPKWQGIKYVDAPGILFVTSENVGEGELILEHRKYVEEKFNLKDKKSILQKGDVLTNIVGASIGRTAIYTIDDVANINQAVCILRCKPELISNQYLMNLLNSPFLKEILHDNEVNTARANLSLGFFTNLSIPLPPLAVQQSIVQKLDALSVQTKKLEAIYQQKINDLEELKKSILQKAFSGELKTVEMLAV